MTNTLTLAYTRYMLPEHQLITHSSKSSVDTRSHTAANCVVAESPRYIDLRFPEGSVRITIELRLSRQILLPQIVLRVEDVLYRVQKSHLAHHSALFCDLFSLPQPLVDAASSPSAAYVKRHPILQMDTTNELEGCPVLRLHDAAEDVENLLTMAHWPCGRVLRLLQRHPL